MRRSKSGPVSPKMNSTTVTGRVQSGHSVASSERVMPPTVMNVIRQLTGCAGLKPGTLNVKVQKPHAHRRDWTLHPHQRPDGYEEVWDFELCGISRGERSIHALILRTATNHWGDCVLEIMAEQQLREWLPVTDHEEVNVTIFANLTEAQKALGRA